MTDGSDAVATAGSAGVIGLRCLSNTKNAFISEDSIQALG
jgi:hypothetical protein